MDWRDRLKKWQESNGMPVSDTLESAAGAEELAPPPPRDVDDDPFSEFFQVQDGAPGVREDIAISEELIRKVRQLLSEFQHTPQYEALQDLEDRLSDLASEAVGQILRDLYYVDVSNYEYRRTIVTVLRRLSQSHYQRRTDLIDALEYEVTGARSVAAEVLGILKEQRAVEKLLECLEKYPEEGVSIARALGRIGHPSAMEPVVNWLLSLSKQGEFMWAEGKNVAKELANFGAQAVPPLLQALSVCPPNVRPWFSDALSMIGTPAIPALKEALSDAQVRIPAAIALANMRNVAATDVLIGSLETTPDATSAIVQALGRTADDPRVGPLLLGFTEHEDPKVRSQVALSLSRVNGEAAEQALLRLLDDWNENVFVSAAQALTHHNSPRAFESLVQTVARESGRLRERAIRALGQVKSAAIPYLDALLTSQKVSDRVAGVQILGRMYRNSQAAAKLSVFFADPSPVVREEVAKAAGSGEFRELMDALLKLINDPKEVPKAQEAARASHRQLSKGEVKPITFRGPSSR